MQILPRHAVVVVEEVGAEIVPDDHWHMMQQFLGVSWRFREQQAPTQQTTTCQLDLELYVTH